MVSDSPQTSERLIAAAGPLFYESGITATGVDRVVQESGVTKPTLYAHFGSKSALVVAVLQRRHDERRVELEAWLEPLSAAEHPLAVFDWLEHFYTDRGERGCGFLNAAAELGDDHPARTVVRAEKAWLRGLLTDGCAAAGCGRPDRVGSQLLLLVDGIAARAVVGGRAAALGAVVEAREAAEVLLSCR